MDRPPRKLIRVSEAMRRLPYGRTRFYQLIANRTLPPLIHLPNHRASFMDESQLDAVIERMVQASRSNDDGR